MQHKISSCYVVSTNAWAKYRKRYRKQWESDPLFQGWFVFCVVCEASVSMILSYFPYVCILCLQCFDTVGWMSGRASRL